MLDLNSLALAASKESYLPEFILNAQLINDVITALPKMYYTAPNIEYSFYRALDSKIIAVEDLEIEMFTLGKDFPQTVSSRIVEAYDFCVIQTCFGEERTTLRHTRVLRDYLFYLETRLMQSVTIPILAPWFYMENILRTQFNEVTGINIEYEPVRNEYLEFMTFENLRAQLGDMTSTEFKAILTDIFRKYYHFDTNYDDLMMWLELPSDFDIISEPIERFTQRVFT